MYCWPSESVWIEEWYEGVETYKMAAILQRLITSCADNQLHLSHGAQPKPLPPHQENQKPSQFTAGDSILLSTSGDTLLWDNRRIPFLISTFLGEDKFICVRCFEIIGEYSADACTRLGVFFRAGYHHFSQPSKISFHQGSPKSFQPPHTSFEF